MDSNSRDLEATPRAPPLDLSHHYSVITNHRQASSIKKYYKFFLIPGIGNLAGGLPNAQFFPFDTLEAQAAKPQRWTPTPNEPPSPDAVADRVAMATLSGAPNGGSLRGGSQPRLTTQLAEQTRVKNTHTGGWSWGRNGNGNGGDDEDKDDDAARRASTHMTVPMQSTQSDPFKKIDLATALQYGTAEGYPPLLSFVRQFTRNNLHPNVPYARGPEVILTCGSTDGMAKSLDLLTTPWDPSRDSPEDRPHILVEKFLYPNVLAQSAPRGIRPVAVEIDGEGLLAHGPGGLEQVLSSWDARNGRRPRLMYTVTMGHNPTSGVLSVPRRREIYALCQKYDVIIIEDDPYWYLQYPAAAAEEAIARGVAGPSPASLEGGYDVFDEGRFSPAKSSGYEFLDSLVPSFLSMDVDGRVIRLDTFSKTIAPGCRLGWITAQPAFIERITRIAETTTQQPSGFVQAMVSELIMGPQTDEFEAFGSVPATQRREFEGWDTSGWVRWLAGLRGAYEGRMVRMSRIFEEGAHLVKQGSISCRANSDSDMSDWGVVTKTKLYEFDWPRGGMFLWLRMRFHTHPLWMARGKGSLTLIDGPALSTALMALCTRKPHLVLPAPGAMFAANDAVKADSAWEFYRLCFAAESEENVGACSRRFVGAIHTFWRIKKVEEIEELVDEFKKAETEGVQEMEEVGNLAGLGMGC